MLTMITEVFGVKGQLGDMVIAPALMPEQYDQEGKASLKIEFAGRKFSIHIFNREKKEWNKVQIKKPFVMVLCCRQKAAGRLACSALK